MRENILRGASPSAKNAKKTACPKGHVYAPLVRLYKNNRRGTITRARTCNRCQADWARANYWKRRDHYIEYMRARRAARKAGTA
jgi:hypothetical protein